MTVQKVKAARSIARADFDGSEALFRACWRVYLGYLRGAIDNPTSQEDIDSWLETLAEEKVNDPRSRFYRYG